MNAPDAVLFIKQHLIDPEVCIRCNTCEETCPVDAITHDSRNYVVNADVCNSCGACVSPCPTGSIDHWHPVPKAAAYSIAEQLEWDELPPLQDMPAESAGTDAAVAAADTALAAAAAESPEGGPQVNAAVSPTSAHAPWSAAHPYLNLYGLKKPVTATVAGNFRITNADAGNDVHHLVLDFGTQFFPLLEGQSVGIVPPGLDANGKPHYLRMYSVASPRTGEREGYNNLSLTVKRVTLDHEGRPVRGVCSNFLCDLQKGDTVQVTGPFGERFLMPNHAGAHLLMVCTGTGAAPMRAMTEHRRRLALAGTALPAPADKPAARSPGPPGASGGKLMLFFGARKPEELPYFGPLAKLPAELIDTELAFSRVQGQPKVYVQDRIRERASDVAELLRGDAHVYICGLKGMEAGVLDAFAAVCEGNGLHWPGVHERMVAEGRFHVETY